MWWACSPSNYHCVNWTLRKPRLRWEKGRGEVNNFNFTSNQIWASLSQFLATASLARSFSFTSKFQMMFKQSLICCIFVCVSIGWRVGQIVSSESVRLQDWCWLIGMSLHFNYRYNPINFKFNSNQIWSSMNHTIHNIHIVSWQLSHVSLLPQVTNWWAGVCGKIETSFLETVLPRWIRTTGGRKGRRQGGKRVTVQHNCSL